MCKRKAGFCKQLRNLKLIEVQMPGPNPLTSEKDQPSGRPIGCVTNGSERRSQLGLGRFWENVIRTI